MVGKRGWPCRALGGGSEFGLLLQVQQEVKQGCDMTAGFRFTVPHRLQGRDCAGRGGRGRRRARRVQARDGNKANSGRPRAGGRQASLGYTRGTLEGQLSDIVFRSPER